MRDGEGGQRRAGSSTPDKVVCEHGEKAWGVKTADAGGATEGSDFLHFATMCRETTLSS